MGHVRDDHAASTEGDALGAPLTEDQRAAIRDAVTEAVLGTPAGLRDALEHDAAASLTLVQASREAAEQTSALLRQAVASARSAGHSWDDIGRLLGVSRQAAQQRFGPPVSARGADRRAPDAPEHRVLRPLSVFEEMAVLEHEGRRGWHVVDSGTLFHRVEASAWQWEHRRAGWAPGVARRMQADGWTPAGTLTFPWGYYKRRLDLPAEAAS